MSSRLIKRLKPMLTALMIASLAVILPALGNCAETPELAGFELAAENPSLILYINPDTTEIAVQDRDTGHIWYSNPPDRHQDRGEMLDRLNSQIRISYFSPGDRLMYLNSYADSVRYHQFNIVRLDNGIRVEYLLGKQWDDSAYLPVIIEKTVFDNVLEAVADESERLYLLSNYTLIQLASADAAEAPLKISQVDASAVFGNYTITAPENGNVTVSQKQRLATALLDQIVKNRSDLKSRGDIKSEHIPGSLHESAAYLLNTNLLPWDEEDMINIMIASGYDPEITRQQHARYNLDVPKPNPEVFWIPVEYRLEKDSLTVVIDAAEIKYPKGILSEDGSKTVALPLYQINVLEFFGAARADDSGYIFVPDGSGGLIDLTRQPGDYGIYNRPVYGQDPTISGMNPDSAAAVLEQIYLPVFGIKRFEQALMTVIEAGDAFANISVNLAGRVNSYSTVSPIFTITPYGQVSLKGSVSHRVRNSAINIYQERPYQGKIKLRYTFLVGEEAGYVGMAKRFRSYLTDRGMEKLPESADLALLLDVIGGAAKKQSVFGLPVEVIEPMTAYNQVKEIVQELKDNEVSSVNVRLIGWLQGGISHRYPDRVYLEPKLGSAEDFTAMIKFLEQNQVGLFPEVEFLTVQRNGLFDGFKTQYDAARFLSGQIAKITQAKFPGLTEPNRHNYLLSPERVGDLVAGFHSDYQRFGLDSLSISAFGRQLGSDFNKQHLIDRQQSLEIITEILADLQNKGLELMIGGGNMYAIPYSRYIISAPAKASSFSIIDRSVPFFQIVFHGYRTYAYQPLNLADNPTWMFLKSIETGAVPYFAVSFEPSLLLKNTDYDYMFSTDYHSWKETIVELYHEINSAFSGIQHQIIVDHQELTPNVFKTCFEDGLTVIVNYNREPVEVHGRIVAEEDYITYFEVEANEGKK